MGHGTDSVTHLSSYSAGGGSCPIQHTIPASAGAIGRGVLISVAKYVAFAGGIAMADPRAMVSNRVDVAGAHSSTAGSDRLQSEPQWTLKGKCAVKLASGPEIGASCGEPVKWTCRIFCGLHSKGVPSQKKRVNSAVGLVLDPPPDSKGTMGGRWIDYMTGDGDVSILGSDGEHESNPAVFENVRSHVTDSKDCKRFTKKLSKIPETWCKAAYTKVRVMGTAMMGGGGGEEAVPTKCARTDPPTPRKCVSFLFPITMH